MKKKKQEISHTHHDGDEQKQLCIAGKCPSAEEDARDGYTTNRNG